MNGNSFCDWLKKYKLYKKGNCLGEKNTDICKNYLRLDTHIIFTAICVNLCSIAMQRLITRKMPRKLMPMK